MLAPAPVAGKGSPARCPGCGSAETKWLWQAGADEAAQHFVLREAEPERHGALRLHIEGLWGGPSCDIMECQACSFGFAWPYVAGDSVFYELAYGSTSYPERRWEFDRTLRALASLPLAGAKALELGAGSGAFLDMIPQERLPRSSIIAVDYSEGARRTLVGKGYRVAGVDIRDRAFPVDLAPFNYVFMFQVLEHMDGLDRLFARLYELTATDARLFIAVPNATRIAFNERHGALRDMPPVHIGKWCPEAFSIVARAHGFHIVDIDREPCRMTHFCAGDLLSHYLRSAQHPRTLASLVRRQPRSFARRVAEISVIALSAPVRVPVWYAALGRLNELGESLWVQLRKARLS